MNAKQTEATKTIEDTFAGGVSEMSEFMREGMGAHDPEYGNYRQLLRDALGHCDCDAHRAGCVEHCPKAH